MYNIFLDSEFGAFILTLNIKITRNQRLKNVTIRAMNIYKKVI